MSFKDLGLSLVSSPDPRPCQANLCSCRAHNTAVPTPCLWVQVCKDCHTGVQVWGLVSHYVGVAPGSMTGGYHLRPSTATSSCGNRVIGAPPGTVVRIRWAEVCGELIRAVGTWQALGNISCLCDFFPLVLPLHWLMSVLFLQSPAHKVSPQNPPTAAPFPGIPSVNWVLLPLRLLCSLTDGFPAESDRAVLAVDVPKWRRLFFFSPKII